jgi:hypothetical protein
MNDNKIEETKKCNRCGRDLPLSSYELMKPKQGKPYYISTCKQCRYQLRAEKKNKLSEETRIIINRCFKDIKPERILNLKNIKIDLIGEDEQFVRLMDYRDAWLSNYGRVIRKTYGKYNLIQGSYDNNGNLKYSLRKNIYSDGEWQYTCKVLYAAKAVVEEFIVNPDVANNIYIWHRGGNKQDFYYQNLYPLNQEQYRIVKAHYNKTEDDSEQFILKVMNDIKFKPLDWSLKAMQPIMCNIGYRGSEDIDFKSETYMRWHDMLNRCYNKKFHEKQPQYKECRVCEEWLNFSNFKVWYEKNKYGDKPLDLDKDILFKGNKIYSPTTCCFVPHCINTLFVNGKKVRGEFPLGVYFEKEKGKYRTCMAFMGKQIKLGTFEDIDSAFARYKDYKENFIKDMAEQYKTKIPDKVYDAMINWKIEITD